jgi:hypothetical protein
LALRLYHKSFQNVEEIAYHAHAWHIPQVCHSKRSYHMMASCWTLSKYSPCSHIFNIDQPKLFPAKVFDLQLLMSTYALFNCTNDGTCIEHAHKSSSVWPHTFLLHSSK